MATGLPVAGQDGGISLNGFFGFLDEYHINPKTARLNTYNYNSQGYDESIPGKVAVTVRVKGYFDLDNIPFDLPGVQSGAFLLNTVIYQSVAQTDGFDFPLLLVDDVVVSNQVEKRVDFEFTAAAVGPWTYPGDIPGNTPIMASLPAGFPEG